MRTYHDVAPTVLTKTEMLADLISTCSKVISAATRSLEVSSGIRTAGEEKDLANTTYNVNRTLIKRVAAMEEVLLALELMYDQQNDPRLARSALGTKAEQLAKLEKWHPEVRTATAAPTNFYATMNPIANPYHEANQEDFDDE